MPQALRPTAPIAADAVLVGDPGRALMLAQELLEKPPKMANHARGLWGYSGRTPAGRELSVMSTGMGGPSAALVLGDLAELGLRRAVRVGTATALVAGAEPGALVVVGAAHLGAGAEPIPGPDPELTAALAAELGAAARVGEAVSFDTLHPPGAAPPSPGEVADMQTAALLRRAEELGVRLAAVLIVVAAVGGEQIDEEGETAAAKAVGRAAAAILSA